MSLYKNKARRMGGLDAKTRRRNPQLRASAARKDSLLVKGLRHVGAFTGALARAGVQYTGQARRLDVLYRFFAAVSSFCERRAASLGTAPAVPIQADSAEAAEIDVDLAARPAASLQAERQENPANAVPVRAYHLASIQHIRDMVINTVAVVLAAPAAAVRHIRHLLMGQEARAAAAPAATVSSAGNTFATEYQAAAGTGTAVEVESISGAFASDCQAAAGTGAAEALVNAQGNENPTTIALLSLLWVVTFVDFDGSLLYETICNGSGECIDPVTTGLISEPTGGMDVQYVYSTFKGWSKVKNGENDESALTNITGPTVLYAVYEKELRYYNISFYDGDSLLTVLSLAYGETPSYTPTKTGFVFDGWYPAVVSVTGDAEYYAQWAEVPTFAAASWATISDISASGEASQYFAVGDTKDVTMTDGTILTFEIIAFNHDDLADGSGKAGITVLSKYVYTGQKNLHGSTTKTNWSGSLLRKALNSGGSIYAKLPADLISVVKPVNKKTCNAGARTTTLATTSDAFWIPSITEIGFTGSDTYTVRGQGTRYSIYAGNTSKSYLSGKLLKTSRENKATVLTYWLRSPYNSTAVNTPYHFIQTSGISGYAYANYRKPTESCGGVVFGFCI